MRFRSNRMNPIQSVKHINQFSVTTVGIGALGQKQLALSVVAPDANAVSEVPEGAKISNVYVELWITSDDASQGSLAVNLEKTSTQMTAMTYAQSIALWTYANKKNIFYTTQGLVPPNVQSGIPFLRGWFKIPAGKQRFGLGDKLVLNISGITNGVNYCGLVIYKHYQ